MVGLGSYLVRVRKLYLFNIPPATDYLLCTFDLDFSPFPFFMLRRFIPSLALSIVLASSLVSCKDNTVQELTVSPEGPALIDGRLNFSSLTSFQAYMKANQNKTVEQLIEGNKAIGFVSHLRLDSEPGLEAPKPIYPSTLHCLLDGKRSTFSSGAKNSLSSANNIASGASTPSTADAVSYADEPMTDIGTNFVSTSIADPLFDSVLDENREMTINSLVFRAGNDYGFYYPLGQEALIDDFYQKVDTGEIQLTDTDMHAFGQLVVQRVSLVTNNTEPNTASALPFVGNRSVEGNQNWDGSNRIECQIWQGNWGIYASSGIKTHATQYARKWVFFHGWVDFRTDRVSVLATVGYNVPNSIGGTTPQTAIALNESETNAAVAVKRFDWATAQIGYTNAPGGAAQQVQSIILSSMAVTIANPAYVPPSTNPRPTFNPSTLTLNITSLTSTHSAMWGSRPVQRNLTW